LAAAFCQSARLAVAAWLGVGAFLEDAFDGVVDGVIDGVIDSVFGGVFGVLIWGILTPIVICNYKFKIHFHVNFALNKTPMNASISPDRLKPRALYEEVAELLRQRIFSRELAAGSWIDELKIAKDYGISRTPLREALKVLATEGLVTMKVRRGAYVTEVSEQDLTEVYHLLSLLESDAAGVVAAKATDAQLAELTALHQQLEASVKPGTGGQPDREKFFAINERFHMTLLVIANNRWRDQMVADLRKVMKLNRHHSLFKTGRVEDSLAEHRAIMAALAARDASAATVCMKAHFQNGLEAAF
jgi:DNA-binding GntR family transcriptional regulator